MCMSIPVWYLGASIWLASNSVSKWIVYLSYYGNNGNRARGSEFMCTIILSQRCADYTHNITFLGMADMVKEKLCNFFPIMSQFSKLWLLTRRSQHTLMSQHARGQSDINDKCMNRYGSFILICYIWSCDISGWSFNDSYHDGVFLLCNKNTLALCVMLLT